MTPPVSPAENPGKKLASALLLAALLPIALYAALASRLIAAKVGFEMDEALYVQPAVFMLRRTTEEPPFATSRASWITLGSKKIALMIMPYVGAAKAYVALPLFRVFGIDARVARWSGVLLGALGIAGLAVLVGRLAGPAPALVAGLLLAVHPTYLDYTVFDNGGVSVWMAGMGGLALALANHLCRRTAASAYILGVAAGLGVWARLNVLWLLGAAAAGGLLVLRRRALPTWREFSGVAAGGFAGALPLVLYELKSAFWTIPFVATLQQHVTGGVLAWRMRALAELMIADGEQRAIWSGPRPPGWQVRLGAILLLAALAALFVPALGGASSRTRLRRALAACTGFLAIILLGSRLAVSQHHLVAVLPLALATLVVLGFEIGAALPRGRFVLSAAAVALAAISLSSYSLIAAGLTKTGGKMIWSSAMYDVATYLEAHPVPRGDLKILSWGLQNGLYVVSRAQVVGSELYWDATDRLSMRGRTWESEVREGGTFLMFAFPTPPFFVAAAGFRGAVAASRRPYEKRVFVDRSGSPIVVVVTVPRQATGRS